MNYCTLFNSFYLSRGLALYRSLLKHAKKFHLYIFAFDDVTYQILSGLSLTHATIIPLAAWETPELLKVKKERTIGEYCWTCTPASTLHCLEKYNLAEICYLDADLFFWQDPQILLDSSEEASIIITDHHYTPVYDRSTESGKYCVQFMYFKNNAAGKEALSWWRDACIEWCYDRVEDGKFGDQKYLDDWPSRFKQVKVLEHLGAGVAPWNVQQYEFVEKKSLLLRKNHTWQTFDLVFYHFHALRFINNYVSLGDYQLSSELIARIYRPYIQELFAIEHDLKTKADLKALLNGLNLHGKKEMKFPLAIRLKNLIKRCLKRTNIYALQEFSH